MTTSALNVHLVGVYGFSFKIWAVPIGVVIATLVSLVALNRANNNNIAADQQKQRDALAAEAERHRQNLAAEAERAEKSIVAQREIALAGLEAQRKLTLDTQLWNKRAEIYSGLVAALQERNTMFSEVVFNVLQEPAFDRIREDHLKLIRDHMSLMVSWPGEEVMNKRARYFLAHRHLDITLGLLKTSPANQPLVSVSTQSIAYAQYYSTALITALRAELKHEAPMFEGKPADLPAPVGLDDPATLIDRFKKKQKA